MVGNYLIGLREGLEAALVVGILIAYLIKSGNRAGVVPTWLGIGSAIAVSLAFGVALNAASGSMAFRAQETFGGVLSIFAVGLVTWMIFWMRKASRFIKADIEGKLASALRVGPLALAAVAFFAVGREGLETALFLWTNIQAAGSDAQPVIGAVLGLVTAAVLGYLLYRRAVKVNLARFFTWTGALLVVVAAGVFGYGFHDLQEAGILPGLGAGFDVSGVIAPDSWYGTLLRGVFNLTPQVTWLQFATWLTYLIAVMTLFLLPGRAPTPAASRKPQPASS